MPEFIAYLEEHPGLFVALGGVAAILGAFVGCIIQYLTMRRQRDKDRDDLNEAKRREGTLEEKTRQLEDDIKHLKEKKAQVVNALENEQSRFTAKVDELDNQHQTKVQELSEEVERFHGEVDARDRKIARQKNLVHRMMQIEGQLWERRALAGAPRFRPLVDRQTAIISILNLKGGVGKTSITAHLAAAFSAKGYRVLAIDLDLQGSLSGMFIAASLIKQKYDEGKLLQHFLNNAAHQRAVNLLDYVHQPIFEGQTSGLLATSDRLAYAEMNLTMSWLLGLARRDTRFLLRRALHQRRVTNEFDIILMDCPPLINTCCVNALAASDYVLIPTLPSKRSAERVPFLLESIKRFHVNVNPHLQVAGVILNRIQKAQMNASESDIWDQVLTHAQDRMGVPVYGFQTMIRQQDREVRQLESESTIFQPGTTQPGSELSETFRKLAEELEERLPRECRRFADASY